MVQQTTPEPERIGASDIDEGDEIILGISPHGSADDLAGVEWMDGILGCGIRGTVTKALSESAKRFYDDDGPGLPMADLKVETDDGIVYTWHVDNGYISGPHPGLGRRSDVGKVAGLYR